MSALELLICSVADSLDGMTAGVFTLAELSLLDSLGLSFFGSQTSTVCMGIDGSAVEGGAAGVAVAGRAAGVVAGVLVSGVAAEPVLLF